MDLTHFKIISGAENIPEPIRSALPTCTPEEAEAVLEEMGRTMRYADRREMKQWTGNGPAYEIRAAVKESEFTFVGFDDDGTVMSIFGGRHENLVEHEGVIWELSSERVNRRKLLFAKQSKIGMDLVMRSLHDVEQFHNFVSEDYESSVRWIEWLGGTMSCTTKFNGMCGGVFRYFYIMNPYYQEESPCA
jgi:hypothetical protein